MAGCRALSDLEVTLVIANLGNPRDRALFVLGVKSGFRISELLSLRVCDVYAGCVLDSVRVSRSNTKGSIVSRTVPLHSLAKEHLHTLCQGRNPVERLFLSRNGANQAISRFQAHAVLKAAYRDAGLTGPGLACHTMRKSFAERVYAALGHDLLAARDALGHSDIRNTVRYIVPNKDRIAAAILS